MSRTYKDKPSKLSYKNNEDTIRIDYTRTWINFDNELVDHSWYYLLDVKTTKPKKRKEVDTEDHWMSTPSWWIRLYMTKPQRRKGRMWECGAAKVDIPSLEDIDWPNVSRKPHIYYW